MPLIWSSLEIQKVLYLPNGTYHMLCYIFMRKSFFPEWSVETLLYLLSFSRCSIVTELKLMYIDIPFGSFILRTFTASCVNLTLGELCTWMCKKILNGWHWPLILSVSMLNFTFLLISLPQTLLQRFSLLTTVVIYE